MTRTGSNGFGAAAAAARTGSGTDAHATSRWISSTVHAPFDCARSSSTSSPFGMVPVTSYWVWPALSSPPVIEMPGTAAEATVAISAGTADAVAGGGVAAGVVSDAGGEQAAAVTASTVSVY